MKRLTASIRWISEIVAGAVFGLAAGTVLGAAGFFIAWVWGIL